MASVFDGSAQRFKGGSPFKPSPSLYIFKRKSGVRGTTAVYPNAAWGVSNTNPRLRVDFPMLQSRHLPATARKREMTAPFTSRKWHVCPDHVHGWRNDDDGSSLLFSSSAPASSECCVPPILTWLHARISSEFSCPPKAFVRACTTIPALLLEHDFCHRPITVLMKPLSWSFSFLDTLTQERNFSPFQSPFSFPVLLSAD